MRAGLDVPARIDIERDEDLVYILAGLVAQNGPRKARRIVVTPEESPLAAFSPSAPTIGVRCEGSGDLDVAVGGRHMKVVTSENSLIVPTIGLPTQNGALMFEMSLAKSEVSAVLAVSLVESVRLVTTSASSA